MKQYKIVVEEHADGFVAYPLGLKGIVVGQGDTYEEAVSDVNSAVKFHLETFGEDAIEEGSEVLQVYLAETKLTD